MFSKAIFPGYNGLVSYRLNEANATYAALSTNYFARQIALMPAIFTHALNAELVEKQKSKQLV